MTAALANNRRAAASPLLPAIERKAACLLRALAFRSYAGTVALAILCCILFLPGIASVPVTDRDEARFAQASKQMLESGNYIDIRFQSEPRYKKPIGIYWLQAAAVKAASGAGAALTDIWAYRIPSFLGAMAAVLLTFWAGRPVLGRERAFIAALLFAVGLTLTLESHIAKSDAALIASIVLAQGALFRLYMAPSGSPTRGLAVLFWLGLGFGILIKGPVAPALSFITAVSVLVLDNRRGWLKNLHWRYGVPLLLAVVLPWFIAIGISSRGEFFRSSLGDDFASKLQSGQEAHWAPPGYYFIAFWLTFWPAILFITRDGLCNLWRGRRGRRVLFLLAWIAPWWLIIEAIPTKLPHYALPLYPAIAMAAVLSLGWAWEEGSRGSRGASVIWSAIGGFLAIAFPVLCWIAEAPRLPLLTAMLAAFVGAAAFTVMASWRGFIRTALCGTVLSAGLFYTAAFGVALPGLQPIWISQTAADAARALKTCAGGPIGLAGFSAPSLVFLNGTDTVLTGAPSLAESLASKKAGLAFVNWRDREGFEQAYRAKTGAEPNFLGCADGIDINGRGPTRLQIYAAAETASAPGCTPPPSIVCRPKEAVRWRRLFNSKF